jgi:hypothetical protein
VRPPHCCDKINYQDNGFRFFVGCLVDPGGSQPYVEHGKVYYLVIGEVKEKSTALPPPSIIDCGSVSPGTTPIQTKDFDTNNSQIFLCATDDTIRSGCGYNVSSSTENSFQYECICSNPNNSGDDSGERGNLFWLRIQGGTGFKKPNIPYNTYNPSNSNNMLLIYTMTLLVILSIILTILFAIRARRQRRH